MCIDKKAKEVQKTKEPPPSTAPKVKISSGKSDRVACRGVMLGYCALGSAATLPFLIP